MIGYAERECFDAAELKLLRRASELVALAPYELPSGTVRCHELTRAVGRILDLPVQDGHHGAVQHSWLWTGKFPVESKHPNILDVYCVGRMPQVQLADTFAGAGHWTTWSHRALYEPLSNEAKVNKLGGVGALRDDIRRDDVDTLVVMMTAQ